MLFEVEHRRSRAHLIRGLLATVPVTIHRKQKNLEQVVMSTPSADRSSARPALDEAKIVGFATGVLDLLARESR